MYSNDLTQIQSGLTQFAASLVQARKMQGGTIRVAKHETAAIMLEETLSLAQDESGETDLYVLKPLLRATLNVLSERMRSLNELPVQSLEVKEKLTEYAHASQTIHDLVESIK